MKFEANKNETESKKNSVYDYESRMTAEDFQKYIDSLMYNNKRLRKSNKKQGGY